MIPLLLSLILSLASLAAEKCDTSVCKAKPSCSAKEELVDLADAKSCCPQYFCRPAGSSRPARNCAAYACSAVVPICSGEQKAVNKASKEACCPSWVCERKSVEEAAGD